MRRGGRRGGGGGEGRRGGGGRRRFSFIGSSKERGEEDGEEVDAEVPLANVIKLLKGHYKKEEARTATTATKS